MTALGFSNYCNLIAQQTGFAGYHYGFESDIYRNIDNNTNVGNSIGNQYPYVLLEQIPSTLTIDSKRISSNNEIRLNFLDLENYTNTGASVSSTFNEQVQVLRNLAYTFIQTLITVGLSSAAPFSIRNSSVNIEVLGSQGNDRLIQVVATLTVFWYEDCPTITFNPADINPAFAFPVLGDTDYEKIKPV